MDLALFPLRRGSLKWLFVFHYMKGACWGGNNDNQLGFASAGPAARGNWAEGTGVMNSKTLKALLAGSASQLLN